ncbi:MAG TPA: DinB family protein [Leptospiraceae bacterium]|nr:DinB family protein [Leptospiraceae bacterium]HMW04455.1 DinB family protein [Leptospiraceae bacterium]HMX31113.1 DinB family protein [Leptospiraceae bacterium]HMY30641.1 DinB family protein [Leptospiraceae bacterium]HMZ65826.1 DinB family protein [Leptospiraceae bacterium]
MKEELTHAYERATHILSYASSNLRREDLLAAPGPGLWSITEVILHIVDCDLVFSDRIKRVIAEENPNLMAFDENKWKENLSYKPENISAAVRLFAANREYISQILQTIKEEDLERTGMHSQAGAMTLKTIIEKANSHFDHHIKFLYAKRANIGKSVHEIYTK